MDVIRKEVEELLRTYGTPDEGESVATMVAEHLAYTFIPPVARENEEDLQEGVLDGTTNDIAGIIKSR